MKCSHLNRSIQSIVFIIYDQNIPLSIVSNNLRAFDNSNCAFLLIFYKQSEVDWYQTQMKNCFQQLDPYTVLDGIKSVAPI